MTHNEVLELAINHEACSINSDAQDQNPVVIRAASAFCYLALEYIKGNKSKEVKEALLNHITHTTEGGHEPALNLGRNWSYPILANAITIVKHCDIWEELAQETKDKLTCLMKGFAYLMYYANHEYNEFETGLRRDTHYNKHWAPNVRAITLAYSNSLSAFFGGVDKLQELYTTFDYDSYIEELTRYGFTNALETFTTPAIETEYGFTIPSAKEILTSKEEITQYKVLKTNGITNYSYGGKGKGIVEPLLICRVYKYAGENLLIKNLIDQIYSKTCQSALTINDCKIGIADKTISPYEGQLGMFYELNQDWRGRRSCIHHAMIDFAIITSTLTTLKAIGNIFDIDKESLTKYKEKIDVGNNDLFYKLEHGYISYNDGPRPTVYESNYAGYYFWKDAWQNR